MSLQGKLLRGLKWYKFVKALEVKDYNAFGKVFLPKEVMQDPHKMEELKFYLKFLEGKDEAKVHKLLESLMLLDLRNKGPAMMLEAKKLDDGYLTEDKPTVVVASPKKVEGKK